LLQNAAPATPRHPRSFVDGRAAFESRPAAMLLITQRAEKPEKKKGSDTGATRVCDVEEY